MRLLGQLVGLCRVHAQKQAALAARAHGHVAVDEEREAAEHLLLGHALLVRHELADAVGQILVVRHGAIMVPAVDEGQPTSWEALRPGTVVFASDGSVVGKVKEVLAVPEDDIFEGVIIDTEHGDRFADWELIGSLHERGVDLKLDGAAAAANLPEPKPAPAA